MIYPNFNEEKKLWKKGYDFVVGIDEAGRGPLSGPVVAAAVITESRIMNHELWKLKKIKDSKKLTARQREEIFNLLKQIDGVEWGIGRVSEKVIDKINILEATKLAMSRAVKNLEKKLREEKLREVELPKISVCQKIHDRGNFGMLDFLIIDGNFGIPMKTPQKSIIKADEKVFSCTCAGIIAKVTRDKIMLNYHKKYPQYGFDKHKGYPTKWHCEMIKKHGYSDIHRRTFKISWNKEDKENFS